jgi:hypothetical protein
VIVYLIYIGVCIISYFATYELVGVVKPYNLKADLFGMDINKKGTAGGEKKIPESMGLVPAVMFLIIGCTATVLIKYLQKDMLVEHLAGLLSICFIIFLGKIQAIKGFWEILCRLKLFDNNSFYFIYYYEYLNIKFDRIC